MKVLSAWISGMVVCAAVPLMLGLLAFAPLVVAGILVYALVSGKEAG